MAHGKTKRFDWINLDEADNGYVLRFTIVKDSDKGGPYDDADRQDREILYLDGVNAEDAFTKFKELHMFNKAMKMGETMDMPDTTTASLAPNPMRV